MNIKKLLGGQKKNELARMAKDILVMLDEDATDDSGQEREQKPYERRARGTDYFGSDIGEGARRGDFESLAFSVTGRGGGEQIQTHLPQGEPTGFKLTDEAVFRGDLPDGLVSLDDKAKAAENFGGESLRRNEKLSADKTFETVKRPLAFGTDGADLGREAAKILGGLLTEGQELGQSRLPERMSELFCRDARRYDGAFARY